MMSPQILQAIQGQNPAPPPGPAAAPTTEPNPPASNVQDPNAPQPGAPQGAFFRLIVPLMQALQQTQQPLRPVDTTGTAPQSSGTGDQPVPAPSPTPSTQDPNSPVPGFSTAPAQGADPSGQVSAQPAIPTQAPAAPTADASDPSSAELFRHLQEVATHAQALREKAAGLPVESGRHMTPAEQALFAIATLFDPTHTAGIDFAKGFQANQEQQVGQEGQRRQQQVGLLETQAQGLDKQAELLGDQAKITAEGEREDAKEAGRLDIATAAQQGKISVAQYNALKTLPVEARSSYAENVLGIKDPATIEAMGRPDSDDLKKLADANYKNVTANPMADKLRQQSGLIASETADHEKFREQTYQNLIQKGDLMGAQKGYYDAKKGSEDARARLYNTQDKWYGPNIQSEIHARNQAAEAAMTRAHAMITRFQNGLSGGKGVTPTAFMNARSATAKQMDTADAAIAKIAEENQAATQKLAAIRTGDAQEDYPGQRADLTKLLQNNVGTASYLKITRARAKLRLQAIDDAARSGKVTGGRYDVDADRSAAKTAISALEAKGDMDGAQKLRSQFESVYGEPVDQDHKAGQ